VNATGVDLRLGYDFLVSIMTRRPSVELMSTRDRERRSINSYFQETRRDLGDVFVLYPNQVALAATLEYVCVPKNMFGEIVSRSSFNRLGVQLSTSVQPGYRGCVSLELVNHGQSPIELVVGGRIVEARFYEIDGELEYIDGARSPRKYLANVRPVVSQADRDRELDPLARIRKKRIETGQP
jgi:dCTP deaminase